MLCVRTVDLFWAFQYHQKGFPKKLHVPSAKRAWNQERQHRHEIADRLLKQRTQRAEIQAYIDHHYPESVPWDGYLKRCEEYFQQERARYDGVLHFWRSAQDCTRAAFLRAAAAFNKRSEGYPDYFAQASSPSRLNECKFGWVEVKSPRDTLNPNQRRFFPELMSATGQQVWIARMRESREGFLFRRLMPDGILGPEESLLRCA
jgi:hypothetical protein